MSSGASASSLEPSIDWSDGSRPVRPEDGKARPAKAGGLPFDPRSSLIEHRPLGEVMRSRKQAYRASQLGRGPS